MNRVIAWLRKNQLGRTLAALLAGMLLIVSTTACNSLTATNPKPEVPSTDTTSSYKGGMNDFSDVDPRAKTLEQAAEAKATVLKENAEKNVIDQTGDLVGNTKRTLDKKVENVKDLGKNLQRDAAETADKAQDSAAVAKEAKRNAEDVKDATLDRGGYFNNNVRKTAKDVKQTIDEKTPDAEDLTRGVKRAGENVKENARDLTDSVKQAGKDVKENTKDLARDAKQAGENVKENTKAAGKDLVDKTEDAGKTTSNIVQEKINQAAEGAKRVLENTGDAVKDAID